jgi:hypothetical protein
MGHWVGLRSAVWSLQFAVRGFVLVLVVVLVLESGKCVDYQLLKPTRSLTYGFSREANLGDAEATE